MDLKKPDRSTLKSYFVKNSMPTAGQFADLIEGLINQRDDGLAKPAGEPLSVQADGDDTSQKKALNFYRSFSDANPAWTVSLNPRAEPTKPDTAKPGWSIGDAEGRSRLFIDQTTGNVGIGTVNPASYKLSVQGPALVGGKLQIVNGNQDANGDTLVLGSVETSNLRLGYHANYSWIQSHGSKPLAINPLGNNVGIGTAAPNHMFHVVAADAVGLFESTGTTAYLRLSTKEGMDNRVELANRPGGQLSLWTAGGGDVLNVTKQGNVGIGMATPLGKLEVIGTAAISNGSRMAIGGYMAAGSLSIGGTTASYGGGQQWNSNVAALMLETQTNTEIAVHDANTRLASLMYYEGDAVNRVTIGRDMGWGPLSQLVLNSHVSVVGNINLNTNRISGYKGFPVPDFDQKRAAGVSQELVFTHSSGKVPSLVLVWVRSDGTANKGGVYGGDLWKPSGILSFWEEGRSYGCVAESIDENRIIVRTGNCGLWHGHKAEDYFLTGEIWVRAWL